MPIDETEEERQRRLEEFQAKWKQQISDAKKKDAGKTLSHIQNSSPVCTGPALGSPQSTSSFGYPLT